MRQITPIFPDLFSDVSNATTDKNANYKNAEYHYNTINGQAFAFNLFSGIFRFFQNGLSNLGFAVAGDAQFRSRIVFTWFGDNKSKN